MSEVSSSSLNIPNTQMISGMKLIQSAYENKTMTLTQEINRLLTELNKKNIKIKELEALSSNLLNDNHQLKMHIERLMIENKKLLSSNGLQELNTDDAFVNKINCLRGKDNNLTQQTIPSSTIKTISMENIKGKVPLKSRELSNDPQMFSLAMKRIDNSTKNMRIDESLRSADVINKSKSDYTLYHSDFLRKCKSLLKKKEYIDLIDIIKMANGKIINKQETINKISQLLSKKYTDLYSEFEDIYYHKNTSIE